MERCIDYHLHTKTAKTRAGVLRFVCSEPTSVPAAHARTLTGAVTGQLPLLGHLPPGNHYRGRRLLVIRLGFSIKLAAVRVSFVMFLCFTYCLCGCVFSVTFY